VLALAVIRIVIDLLDPWRANNFLALHATPYDEHSYEVIRREPEGYLDSPIYYQRGMANTLVLFLQAKYEQTRVVVLRQVSHSSDYGVQLLKQRMLEKTNTNHKHTHSHRKHYQKKRNFKHRYLLLVHGIRTQLPMQKQNPILILWLMWLQVFLKNFLRMVHGT
jgi:hypothetical protein